MHPLPEVQQAADRLAAAAGTDVAAGLAELAGMAERLFPSCIGVSLALAHGHGTVTAVQQGLAVRATRSIPLRASDSSLLAVLHLYAADAGGFDDPSGGAPPALGGPAADGVVPDADLGFSTLEQARRLPELLDERSRVEQAKGVLMHERACSPAAADRYLRQEAAVAGLPVLAAADLVLARSG